MPGESHSRPSGRETLLTVLLGTLAAGGFFLFLVMILGLMVFQALGIFALLFFFGFAHWLLWGRSMSQQAALEREAEDETPELGEWPDDGPHGPRRY